MRMAKRASILVYDDDALYHRTLALGPAPAASWAVRAGRQSAAGLHGCSMSMLARMSQVFGGLNFWPSGRAP